MGPFGHGPGSVIVEQPVEQGPQKRPGRTPRKPRRTLDNQLIDDMIMIASQPGEGRPPTPSRRIGVVKLLDPFERLEQSADGLALYADTASVNDAQSRKPHTMRFQQVFFGDRLYISRWDRMQIESIGDWNQNWFVHKYTRPGRVRPGPALIQRALIQRT